MQAQDKREGWPQNKEDGHGLSGKAGCSVVHRQGSWSRVSWHRGKKHKKVRVDLSVADEEVRVDNMSVVSDGCRREGPPSSAREKRPEFCVFCLPNLLQINVIISSKILIWLFTHLTVLSSHVFPMTWVFLQMNNSYLLSPCLQNNIFKKLMVVVVTFCFAHPRR